MKKIYLFLLLIMSNICCLIAQTEVLVSGEHSLDGMEMYGNDLYVTSRIEGKIYKMDTTSANPSLVEVVSGLINSYDIAFYGNELYVANNDRIVKININDTNPTITNVIAGLNSVLSLEVKDDYLYFSEYHGNKISKVNLVASTLSVIELASGLDLPDNLEIIGDNLFFTDNNGALIKKMNIAEDTPTVTDVASFNTFSLTSNDNILYTAQDSEIYEIDLNDAVPTPSLVVSIDDIIVGVIYNTTDENLYMTNWETISNTSISRLVPCFEPLNISVSDITLTTANITWLESGLSEQTSWEVEYGPTGFTQGDGVTITTATNALNLSNLTEGTDYDFYVRANCDAQGYSTWAGPISFTTIPLYNDLEIMKTPIGHDQYTKIPLAQVASIANGRTIRNIGTLSCTNVILTVSVSDSSLSEVYTETSSPQTIDAGSSSTITFSGFTPTILDNYTVTYTLSLEEADVNTSNNTMSSVIEISAHEYARDNNIVMGNLGFSNVSNGRLGQQFDILEVQDLSSVTFQIVNPVNLLDGSTTFVTIWDMVANMPNAIVAQTELVTINGINQSYTADVLGGPFSLQPGTYIFTVEQQGTENISLATTEDVFKTNTTWLTWPAIEGWRHNEDYNFYMSYILRPNLQDPPALGTQDYTTNRSTVSIFPNPTKNRINLSGLSKTEHYTIYSALGLKVSNGKIINGGSIAVHHLSNGVYFLKLDDGTTLKFVKE